MSPSADVGFVFVKEKILAHRSSDSQRVCPRSEVMISVADHVSKNT